MGGEDDRSAFVPLATRFSPRLARALFVSRLMHRRRFSKAAAFLGRLAWRWRVPLMRIDAPGERFAGVRARVCR